MSAWRTEGFAYGCDNGKWRAFSLKLPWDEAAFLRFVEARAAEADFLVVPDVVGEGTASLALTLEWLPRLRGACKLLLIAVQDGMTPADVDELVGPGVGIFLGGSTEWKLQTMPLWGRFCQARGLYLHVGRVNTAQRLRAAIDAGAHSVDGSGAARFEVTIGPLTAVAQEPSLIALMRDAA